MSYKKHSSLIDQIKNDATLVCTRPWTSLEERSLNGEYRICCFINAALKQIEKDSDDDPLQLFNHANTQKVRRAFSEGNYDRYCPQDCPILIRKKEVDPSFTDFNEYDASEYTTFGSSFLENREKVLEAVVSKSSTVDAQPTRLKLHPSNTCNLRCRMCLQSKDDKAVLGDGYRRTLRRALPFLEELIIFGGEPFACRFTRDVLFGEELKKHSQIHVTTITNGTLLDKKTLEQLRAIRLGTFSFSLDACSKKVYENIRIGGTYEETFGNLRNFVHMRDRGDLRIREIEANFTIQQLNYREIPEFVTFAHELNITTGFGLIEGFDELGSDVENVRESIQAGIETARSLGDTKTMKELHNVYQYIQSYEQKIKKLGLYYSLLSFTGGDGIARYLRRHPRLKKIAKGIMRIK